MPRDNNKRRRERRRRRQLFELLRLQAEILCESHDDDGRAAVVLNRMMKIILGMTARRRLNQDVRQALAWHLEDCALPGDPRIELGGPYSRNSIHIEGSFDIGDLAQRLIWTESRSETIQAQV